MNFNPNSYSNNTQNLQSVNRIGEQDLNPLSSSAGTASSLFQGNQMGPNHPIFNSGVPTSNNNNGMIQPPQGSRFDPIFPNPNIIGPRGNNMVGSNNNPSTFGQINPSHHKAPQFDDDELF